MMKLNIEKTKSFSLTSFFLVLTTQYLIILFLNLSQSKLLMVQTTSKGIVGFSYFISFVILFFYERRIDIILNSYLSFTIIILLHLLLFPENINFMKEALFEYFLISIPSFVISFSLKDWQLFYDISYKASKYILYLSLIIILLNNLNVLDLGIYSMTLSNYLLFPALFFIDESFNKRRKIDFFSAILSFILIVSYGSRGPLISIICYFFFKIFKSNKNGKKMIILLTTLILTFSLLYFRLEIFEYLYIKFLDYGIDARTLRVLMEQEIHSSGRDQIYSIILKNIKRNPLFGSGVFSDRRILSGIAPYTHNLFLDLWLHFGVIIGSIIIFVLSLGLYLPVKNKSSSKTDFLFLWGCLSIIPLLVSNSYLTDFRFWVYLGLLTRFLLDNFKKYKTIKRKGS